MNAFNSRFLSATRFARPKCCAAPQGVLALLALLALAACNGTAVVTLTSTASQALTSTVSQDTFLTYRVGLTSIQVQKSSSGGTAYQALPSGTTVDLAKLVNLSEVVGAAAIPRGSYSNVVITLDYSSAEIVVDDGTVNGLALTPVGVNGQALGQVQLTLDLDPANNFSITSKEASLLALDFKLAASNIVNLTEKTVTVTPLIIGSAAPIDTKTVRVRGPFAGASTSETTYSMGIMPFDFPASGAGSLVITPSGITTYEINGTASTGTGGFTQLAALTSGIQSEAFGTFTASDTTNATDITGTTTDTTGTVTSTDGALTSTGVPSSSTNVSFSAAEVLAGSSVQGSGFDRVSGIVSARSGNTLTVEDGTLLANNGTNSFVSGTTTITIGANTAVNVFGQGSPQANATQQVSVGSLIYAFGTAATTSAGNATLDASAGRVRLGNTTASGLVTLAGTGTLTLNLTQLGGRSTGAFEFAGTGTSASVDASASEYQVSTGALDLTNSTVGVPVEVSGLVTSFGQAPPDFTATTLLDPTTISAELVIDFGAGTPAPFTAYNSSEMDVDIHNGSVGPRHAIQVGAQYINTSSLSSDPLITPNPTSSTLMFAIGHTVSGTVENFNEYANFIATLQEELNGTALATGVTAMGQYAASTFSFAANSITVTLNN